MANTMKFGNGQWATKKDSILAFNDESANFKPLPFATSRASTATRVNKAGLLETVASGIPRVDYLGNTKGALLLEPQSTNLLTYSETFSNSSWTKSGASVVGDFASPSADSPSGAFALTSTGTGQIQAALFGQSAGVEYTVSFWIKRKTGSGVVNLRAVENTSTPITITNEWARYSATVTSSSTTVRAGIRLDTVGDEIYIFGAQLEVGSYATSYIPTSGSAITRLADTASQTVPDGIIGQTEGTIFADVNVNGLKNDNTFISVNNGSFSEYIIIAGNVSGKINAYIFDNGSLQAGILSPDYSLGRFKCALSYSLNSVSFYINGTKIGSDISATIPTTNILSLGSLSFFTAPLNGKINQSLVYNTALTDAELAKLTTI